MVVSLRGLYLEFAHDRPADWDFLRRWQPSVVRLKVNGSHTDPNSISIDKIQRLYDATGARVLIRCWDVDDRRGDGNPGIYAELQADAWQCALDYHNYWRRFMDRLPAALRDNVWAGAINEPHPDLFPQTFEFTDRLLELGTRDGVGYGVFMFSVGTPPLPSENMPFGWQKFSVFDDRIADGGHVAVVHEYMQPEGMYAVWTDDTGRQRRDYGYLIGRHLSSGLRRAPIIIGEWGIEGLIYNRHPDPAHGGHSGWLNFRELWGPERYADEYVECIRQAAPNVIAICPFGSDIPDPKHTWNSFDVMPAYGALLSRKELCIKADIQPPVTTFIPVVSQPGPTPPTAETPEPQPEPTASDSTWERSIAFVLGVEGGLSVDPNDPGNYRDGKFIGSKFGISAAVWGDRYDIVNLTIEQAKSIYFEHYWQASGASVMPWPLCLAHLDLAVNGGVGRAQQALAEAGPDFTRLMAWRLAWYTRLPQFDLYGRAWTKRCADLLNESTRTV
jgi:hypothetical protein